MNTPNPLIPQGTNPYGKSKLRIVIITVLLLHGAFLSGFLIQGCSKDKKPADEISNTESNAPDAITTNDVPSMSNDATVTIPNTNPATDAAPAYQPTGYQPPITQPGASVAPVTQPGVAPTAPANTTEYIVVRRDFPARIAKQHNICTKALLEANPGLNPTKLKIGQKIQIPASATTPVVAPTVGTTATPDATTSPVPDGSIYTVKQGDVLSRIAAAHGTTVSAIVALNNLKSRNNIQAGQKLKMPAPKTPATPAVVPAAPVTTPSAQPAGFNYQPPQQQSDAPVNQ